MTSDVSLCMLCYIKTHKDSDAPFDVVHGGMSSGKDLTQVATIIASYAAVRVTWWIAKEI
ncbi:MAG: hypothetical protein NVS3B14_02590 [Ktedonobacteraceae bacterium]